MKISQIQTILQAHVLSGGEFMDREVQNACGSDMMSDVLAFVKDQAVLVTGLTNPQVVRTASMMDMSCIIFVRGKTPGEGVLMLAREMGIVVLATEQTMFTTCGILYENGLRGGTNTSPDQD